MGPLARLIVGYAFGNATIRQHVDALLKTTGFPASVLFSTIGRTAARCVETLIIADAMVGWLIELQLNTALGRSRHVDQLRLRQRLQGHRGLRSVRGASRLARSLGAGQGRPDRQLSGGRPDDLERVPARRQGQAGGVRGGAGGGEARQAGRAAGDPPHDPQLRSLPGVRGPPRGCARARARDLRGRPLGWALASSEDAA